MSEIVKNYRVNGVGWAIERLGNGRFGLVLHRVDTQFPTYATLPAAIRAIADWEDDGDGLEPFAVSLRSDADRSEGEVAEHE